MRYRYRVYFKSRLGLGWIAYSEATSLKEAMKDVTRCLKVWKTEARIRLL